MSKHHHGEPADIHDAHLATLDLLEEVRDYLACLPVHPMTYSVIQKVNAHIADPMQAGAREVSERLQRQRETLVGGVYTHTGITLLKINIYDLNATLKADHTRSHGDRRGENLLLQLREGIHIPLHPPK
jgi:hypothetical protein